MNRPKPRGIRKVAFKFRWHRIPLENHEPTAIDLNLPEGWIIREEPIVRGEEEGDLIPVAIAVPETVNDALLTIWTTRLDREIAPGDWLAATLEQRGETRIEDDRIPAATDHEAFALAGGVDNQVKGKETEFTTGWAVHKRGDFLVIVRVAFQGTMLSRLSFARIIAASSRVYGGTAFPYAEALRRIAPQQPVDFVTLYPEKWEEITEVMNSADATSILLRDTREGKSVGEIAIMTVPDRPGTTADTLMKSITNHVTAGALVAPRLRPKPAATPLGAISAWSASAVVPREGFNSELEIHVFQTATGWMVLSHWRLAREHGARQWAINRRAIELVLRYLRFESPADDDPDYGPLTAICGKPETSETDDPSSECSHDTFDHG